MTGCQDPDGVLKPQHQLPYEAALNWFPSVNLNYNISQLRWKFFDICGFYQPISHKEVEKKNHEKQIPTNCTGLFPYFFTQVLSFDSHCNIYRD